MGFNHIHEKNVRVSIMKGTIMDYMQFHSGNGYWQRLKSKDIFKYQIVPFNKLRERWGIEEDLLHISRAGWLGGDVNEMLFQMYILIS